MKLIVVRKGGSGSGHYGHAGRPGEQGGSLPGDGDGKGSTVSGYSSEDVKILEDNGFEKLSSTSYRASRNGKVGYIRIDGNLYELSIFSSSASYHDSVSDAVNSWLRRTQD